MPPRKELCSVYTVNGFMHGRPGQYRIITLARSEEDAAVALGLSRDDGCLFRVSKNTYDWTAFDDKSAVGDIFATPYGTNMYEAVDADQVYL